MASNAEVGVYITNYDLLSSLRAVFIKGSTAANLIGFAPQPLEINNVQFVVNGVL